MKTELIKLEKTKKLPASGEILWANQLLARLLTEIAIEGHFSGSIFAEAEGNIVEFKVSVDRQKFLTKNENAKTIAKYRSSQLTRFVTYIDRDLFKLKPSSMCSGILKIKFSDENQERLFSVYSRRSGRLGDFLQIDQFRAHL